jgi:uncharacterized protein YecE (DUF72 family)
MRENMNDDEIEGPVRVGCSGWSYVSWADPVYHGAPSTEWLELYARRFDTVEVNATFYRLPTRKAVQGWADATPAGFVFAVKASRYLTHVKRLQDLGPGLDRFYDRLTPLASACKLGPVLWQLPANFRRDDQRLGRALELLPAGRHCFEFRHPSWFVEEVYELLREHDAALVIADHPSRPFQSQTLTAGWTYVRFHHGHKGRRGNYSPTELRAWGERLRSWSIETWVYFNNDWEAFAVRNAQALSSILDPAARRKSGRHATKRPSGGRTRPSRQLGDQLVLRHL